MRALLLTLPALIVAVLVQAAWWVPRYDNQGEVAPQRLVTFIEPSIGDARVLNPILNADTASSRITALLFDGLLKIGEDLSLQPALAERWLLDEHVVVLPAPGASATDTALALRQKLPQSLSTSEAEVVSISIDAPMQEQRYLEANPDQAYTVDWPQRVRVHLSRVEPDVDKSIIAILQPMASQQHRQQLVTHTSQPVASLDPQQVAELLPNIERNPRLTFWLRKDVRFHDGHTFDAGDVTFTFDAIMDPQNRSPRRSSFEPVKSVTVLDSHQVQVTYKRLFSPAVSAWTIGILPQHLLASVSASTSTPSNTASMRDSAFNRTPIGTGAFQFRQWRSDEYIHLAANTDYFLGRPRISEYFFRILPDLLTQEIEFRAGAVDSYSAQPHQAQRYREDTRFRTFSATQPGYTYIGYNLRRAPFDDPRMRQALGMAIDTQAIIRFVLFNEGQRVTGPFANVSQWYNAQVPALAHDPQRAAQLLEDMGYVRGEDGWLERDAKRLEFNLITNNGNPQRKAVATIVQRAWQKLGVKVNVQLFEWAVFLKDFVNPGEFDAVVLGWRLDLDPDLYQIWHSSQAQPNQLNFVGFNDPPSDQLIEDIRREYSPHRQRELAYALHERIASLQPYTFLYAPRSTVVLDKKIMMHGTSGLELPRASNSGDIYYHMNKWQKVAHAP